MFVSWDIREFEALSSTQDEVKQAALSGAPEGMVVHASMQRGGRGRHGREWISQEGNLFLSLLLRPDCAATDLGFLSLIAGVALHRTAKDHISDEQDLLLKWPNDLLLDGQKCAGILIDTDLTADGVVQYAIVGVGVNLAQAPEMGVVLGRGVDVIRFRDAFLNEMMKLYAVFSVQSFDLIRAEWRAAAHKKGSRLSVKIADRREEGTFEGLDAKGNLILGQGASGSKVITAGDVFLEGASDAAGD